PARRRVRGDPGGDRSQPAPGFHNGAAPGPQGWGVVSGGTWIILGASSSIARAFARIAADEGYDIVLAGRGFAHLERSAADIRVRAAVRVAIESFDATDFAGHPAFARRLSETIEGPIDLFLAFGTMPEQEAIDRDFALARLTIETNYLGAVSVLSAFAPILEARGAGHVVVLGSRAGERGRLESYVYGSAQRGLGACLQ